MDTTAEPVTLPEFVRLLRRAHGPAVERLTAEMEVAIVPTAYLVPERREVGVPHLAAVPAHDPMLFLTLATRWRIALTEVPRG